MIRISAGLRVGGRPGKFRDWIDRSLDDAKKAVQTGVAASTEAMKTDMRQAVGALGFKSQRLENTIRSAVFPRRGNSLSAAGVVYARGPSADVILTAHARGAVIRPTGGNKYLAIPTGFNRPLGRRVGDALVSTQQMMDLGKQGLAFIVPAENGPAKLWMLKVVEGRRKANGIVRPVAIAGGVQIIGRNRVKRTRKYIQVGYAPMFVLVPEIILKKRLDADGIHLRWSMRVIDLIEAALPDDR